MNDRLVFGAAHVGPNIRRELMSPLGNSFKGTPGMCFYGIRITEMSRDEALALIVRLHETCLKLSPIMYGSDPRA